MCKLQLTTQGQRSELPRTNQDTHSHQTDYNQSGRRPHGGSSRINDPTRHWVRTAAELCERPSNDNFSPPRFRQKPGKPHLTPSRTMVRQTWTPSHTARLQQFHTNTYQTKMCDIRLPHTWPHCKNIIYCPGLFPRNYNYLNTEFYNNHLYPLQLLLARAPRTYRKTPSKLSSTKRMHPDGGSQCSPCMVARTYTSHSMNLTSKPSSRRMARIQQLSTT